MKTFVTISAQVLTILLPQYCNTHNTSVSYYVEKMWYNVVSILCNVYPGKLNKGRKKPWRSTFGVIIEKMIQLPLSKQSWEKHDQGQHYILCGKPNTISGSGDTLRPCKCRKTVGRVVDGFKFRQFRDIAHIYESWVELPFQYLCMQSTAYLYDLSYKN